MLSVSERTPVSREQRLYSAIRTVARRVLSPRFARIAAGWLEAHCTNAAEVAK